jgi:hypothetical protein
MHPDAYRFIAETIGTPTRVLELGSLDINGSPRALVLRGDWYGIDMQDGPAVNEVADASIWRSSRRFDLVVCAEVLEPPRSRWAPDRHLRHPRANPSQRNRRRHRPTRRALRKRRPH